MSEGTHNLRDLGDESDAARIRVSKREIWMNSLLICERNCLLSEAGELLFVVRNSNGL
jgi:hypothetical protein